MHDLGIIPSKGTAACADESAKRRACVPTFVVSLSQSVQVILSCFSLMKGILTRPCRCGIMDVVRELA